MNRLRLILLYMSFVTAASCSIDADGKKNNSTGKEPKKEAQELPNGKSIPGDSALTPTFSFSDVAYLTASTASAEEIKARVKSANNFHFKLAKLLSQGASSDNIVVSAYSVQAAFSLLYPGVEPGTASAGEFVEALGFSADLDTFAATMQGQLLAVEKAFSTEVEDSTLKYSLVNQVWTDTEFGLQADYLDTIKRYYNSGVGSLPLRSEAEKSRQTINAFIAHNTNDLIKDLIPPNAFNKDTAAVLTNSVYMLADWARPFEKDDTYEATFTNADGTIANPRVMHQSGNFGYAKGGSFKALSMDYVGNQVAMLIVLPDGGAISDFEAAFGEAEFSETLSDLVGSEVRVSLPKFEIEWGTMSLKGPLEELGMKAVFDDTIDSFPKLLTQEGEPVGDPTYIQKVFHKAKIVVDEKGTEAAAATAIVAGVATSAPADEPKVFNVDRPALFFIYEKENHSILFGGRLANLK